MRKEIIGESTLYLGDCFEILPEIANADCVITDPPYGCTRNEWDKPIDLPRFWELVNGASKKNAAQCVFCQMPFSADLFLANRKNFRYEYIYPKPVLTGFLDSRKKPMKAHELIYVFYQAFPKYEPQKTKGKPYKKGACGVSQNYGTCRGHGNVAYDGHRFPTSIMQVQHDKCFYGSTAKEFPRHPTQKSIAAISLLVKTYTDPGEIILDPYMGSASTGVAAVNNGRSFIGIEQDEHWFDVACRRIEAACSERALLRLTQAETGAFSGATQVALSY